MGSFRTFCDKFPFCLNEARRRKQKLEGTPEEQAWQLIKLTSDFESTVDAPSPAVYFRKFMPNLKIYASENLDIAAVVASEIQTKHIKKVAVEFGLALGYSPEAVEDFKRSDGEKTPSPLYMNPNSIPMEFDPDTEWLQRNLSD